MENKDTRTKKRKEAKQTHFWITAVMRKEWRVKNRETAVWLIDYTKTPLILIYSHFICQTLIFRDEQFEDVFKSLIEDKRWSEKINKSQI